MNIRPEVIELFRALADETRQEILGILEEHERNVNEICQSFASLKQPTISHHLQILKRCKVVSTERRGKMIYYSLNKKVLRNGVEEFVEHYDIRVIG